MAAPTPAATPYNVACANGHSLRGFRTEGYQALRCPTCGEAVFILPRSPLPEPPAPTALARARPVPAAVDAWAVDDAPHALADPPPWTAEPPSVATVEVGNDVAEVDWVDEPAPRAPEAPAARPGAAATSKPPAPPRPRPRATMPTPTAPVSIASAPRLTWGEWATARRNPLLAAGLVLVVLGAVAIRRHRQRLEDLPRVAEIGRTEGFRKLDAGDFFAAKKILADASAAVDAMGGRFEGADSIRQAAREAAILADLVPRSLEELVEEADTYDVAGWSAHFVSLYAGRSVVLETTIMAVPDPSKPESRYEDAYRILAGRGPKPKAQGRLDYAGFALFEQAQPKVDEVKLIGARLAALEFNIAENTWVFTLEPDSGVFITHARALDAIHWPAGEPVEEVQP